MRAGSSGDGSGLRAVVAAGVMLGAAGVSHAQFDPFSEEEPEPHVRLELVSDHASIGPGQAFNLGLSFDIDPGWHMYWNGKNDTGYAPSFTITAPDGFELGEARWPAPKRHVSPGDILDHVYADRVTIIVPVSAPEALDEGSPVEFSVVSDWLVCEAVCIPEEGEAELTIEAGGARASEKQTLALFEATRARLPRPAPDSVWSPGDGEPPFRVIGSQGTKPMLLILAAGADRVRFMPGADCPAIPDLIAEGDKAGAQLLLPVESHDDYYRVTGIVEVVTEDGSAFYWLPVRYPADATGHAESEKAGG